MLGPAKRAPDGKIAQAANLSPRTIHGGAAPLSAGALEGEWKQPPVQAVK
jgi:hypothetical protein